ncbi:MAG: aminotransferase class I/II-fold pyridoxal phosphate-dependent enzyme, partial [Clostridium sp.]
MNYNFDEIINRKQSKCRKWDNKILKEKFGLTPNAIPMDLADLDFKCAPAIVNALTERALLGDYGYTYAYDEYYDAIIDWNKRRFNIELKKEWITLTFGTVSTLHYIVQALLNEGEAAMINTPAYDPFKDAIVRQGCQLVCSPLKIVDNRYYFDFEDMIRKIKEENVKLFILCSPQNPSGRVWSYEELNEVSRICLENNVV